MTDPILLDLPERVETRRLVVRCPQAGDGPAIFEAVRDSLENLRRFPESMGWALAEPSPDASELFARQSRAAFLARRDFPLSLLDKRTGVVVGGSGLHRPDWSLPSFEIGWWGRTAFLGQGLITEAVVAVLDLAFGAFGARRVEALADDLNSRSCALCERVGMALEGVMRHERMGRDGVPRNTRLYAVTR